MAKGADRVEPKRPQPGKERSHTTGQSKDEQHPRLDHRIGRVQVEWLAPQQPAERHRPSHAHDDAHEQRPYVLSHDELQHGRARRAEWSASSCGSASRR